MIFKRLSLQRKRPELCYICEQEMLKSNFFSKNKNFRNALLGYILALVISFIVHNKLIHKVWVDLINERQHKTQGFLSKISESHWTNLCRGVFSAFRNLQLLESDWITWLVLLCCSFRLWIYCGSTTRQQLFELSLSFKQKKDFLDRFVDILCTLARR